jgi:hypothetical protein
MQEDEEKVNAYRVLLGKSEGKTQLGRYRPRYWNNIKMNLNVIGWEDVNLLIWLMSLP